MYLRRKLMLLLPVLSMFIAGVSFAEEAMEEVVVTGSYIKQDSFDSPSPLTVVDQADIAANATPALGEIIVNQTFNYGSDFTANTYAARGQEGNTISANLRGLGAGATLLLIDGRRTTQNNLNNLLPQVAIARMDILKDGASALYGTDAVAGVVNVITRKNYSGAEMSGFYTEDGEGDHYSASFDFIMGSPTDNGHFTIAGSYRKTTVLEQTERPEYLRKGYSRSGTGNPGTWLVPKRDATGALTGGASRTPDPGCGTYNGSGTDVGVKNNYRSGHKLGTTCYFEFGEFWNYVNPTDHWTLWSNFQYAFSDKLTNEIDFMASRQDADSRGSPQNPGGRTEEFPIVLGDHPGNPYRAMADRGAGLEPLYAQDADGDGVPDRGTADVNGDGVMDVILAADPFDSTMGIPFNEDVDVIALRIFGKLGAKPSSFHSDGSNTGNATFVGINYRILDSMTYDFDNGWELSGYLLYQKEFNTSRTKNTSQAALTQGLMGELVQSPSEPDPTYWNPFSTQELHCENRVCSYTGTADFANTQSVVDAVNIEALGWTDEEFIVGELVAVGDLFTLGPGDVKGALGYQYRSYTLKNEVSESYNQCDWHQGGCAFDWDASEQIDAVFFETVWNAPDTSVGSFDLHIAGRYDDYGGGLNSFDPKISLRWEPTQWFALRGSYGTAFVTPSLTSLYSPETCGLQTMVDYITGDTSGTFRIRCAAGNPNLEPEEADVWNVGLSFALLDGDLRFGVDYAEYDFTNRISAITGQQVLNRDRDAFEAAGFTIGSAADVATWVSDPRSDNNIYRDVTGVVTRVVASSVNANKMDNKSWDLYASYQLGLENWGDLRFRIDATFVQEYSYDLGFGAEVGDGAGSQNETIAEVPPLPEWRVNGTMNWNLGNHQVMVRVRWIDSFDQDIEYFARYNDPTIDSITYTDASYAYTFQNLFGDGRSTRIELGGRNIFDEMPKPLFNLGGIESFVHDIRGQMLYVRLNQDI